MTTPISRTELQLVPSTRTESGFELRYYDHAYPVAPGTGPADGETAAGRARPGSSTGWPATAPPTPS